MKKIELNLPQKNIEIVIGKGAVNVLLSKSGRKELTENAFIIADKNVYKFFPETVKNIANAFVRSRIYSFNATEKNKSFEGIEKIYTSLINMKFGRDTTIIAVGGGVTGDVAGFVASTYSRGVKLIHIPTTLLAAVDSSIGGKTGINFNETKNIIGSFYQPEKILIDTNFLITLEKRELISGFGEILKYALLTDGKFFNYLVKNLDQIFEYNLKTLEKIILESAKFKVSVVEEDEKESGLRQLLNLGHTFAHAYEVEKNYKLRHGEAVIAGLVSATLLSEKLGYLNSNLKSKLFRLIAGLAELNFSLAKINPPKCYSIMLHDKKNRDGKIKFVLPIDFGEYLLGVEADRKIVLQTIEETIELFS